MIKFFSWQYLSCNRFVITVSDWGIFVHIRQKALPEKISWIIARKSFSLCASLYVTMQLSSLTDDVDCWTSTLYRMIEAMMEKRKIIRLSVLRQILEQEKITRAGNPSRETKEHWSNHSRPTIFYFDVFSGQQMLARIMQRPLE